MSLDDDNDDDNDDANEISIYDQKIFNFCGRIKSCKIFLKLQIQGQQPNNRLPEWSEKFRADRS